MNCRNSVPTKPSGGGLPRATASRTVDRRRGWMMKSRGRGRHRGSWNGRAWTVLEACAAVWLISGCAGPEPTEGEEPPPAVQPVPVTVATAKQTTLRPSVDLVGTLVAIPERTAVVSPQTEGTVKSVTVAEGEAVRAGEVLIHLDPRTAQARLSGPSTAPMLSSSPIIVPSTVLMSFCRA